MFEVKNLLEVGQRGFHRAKALLAQFAATITLFAGDNDDNRDNDDDGHDDNDDDDKVGGLY